MTPLDLAFYLLLLSLVLLLLVNTWMYIAISRKSNPLKTVKIATITDGILLAVAIVCAAAVLLSSAWVLMIMFLPIVFAIQYLIAPWSVLRTARARDPSPEESWLRNLLEDVKKAAGYSKEVKLKVADIDAPNAFAVSNVFTRAIVVHRGLLQILTPEEIKAVLAHELSHIKRRDTTYGITFSLLPYVLFMSGLSMVAYANASMREGSHRPEAGLAGIFGVIILLLAFLLTAGVLGFSRVREHLADLFSAEVTKSDKIVDALAKLEKYYAPSTANKKELPSLKNMFYIFPMLYIEMFGFINYFRWARPVTTHPPFAARKFVVEKYMEYTKKA